MDLRSNIHQSFRIKCCSSLAGTKIQGRGMGHGAMGQGARGKGHGARGKGAWEAVGEGQVQVRKIYYISENKRPPA